jgi:ankyrin repeat protein
LPALAIASLEQGADIEARDIDSRTTVHLAVANNHLSMVELLLENHGNPETYDENHRTPLLDAVARGYSRIVDLLLKHGVDINARDQEQRTTLHLAAESGGLKTLTGILALKPNTTLLDRDGDTALKVIRRQPTLDLRDPDSMIALVPQLKDSREYSGSYRISNEVECRWSAIKLLKYREAVHMKSESANMHLLHLCSLQLS